MLNKQIKYQREIIRQLYFQGNRSCAEISHYTKKSIPLTIKVLNDLMDDGIVYTNGLAESKGGRRAHAYTLNRESMYILAIAMDQLITKIAILDMNNQVVGETRKADIPLKDNANALNELIEITKIHIKESGIAREKIIGIGVGMPGFVDVVKGVNYSFLKTNTGQSIVSIMEKEIGIPVLIDNDSSLIALAELRFGAAKNKKTALVINIGWGVGLGIIVHGELFNGHNGFAGEFSHLSIFQNDKMCSCGKTGCLETETSLLAITEKTIKGLGEGRTSMLRSRHVSLQCPEETAIAIIEAALNGDRFAVELISEAGYNLGKGIAILIHLLNPELIILSGRGASAEKLWFTPIQQAINEYCIPKIAENTTVQVSLLKTNAEIIGAASLVMDKYEKMLVHSHTTEVTKEKIPIA